MTEVDGSRVHPVVDVVYAENPFAAQLPVRFGFRPQGGCNVQAVVIRQALLVAQPVVRDYQAFELELAHRVVGGLSGLVDEIGIEAPAPVQLVIRKDGQIVGFVIGGAVPLPEIDAGLYSGAAVVDSQVPPGGALFRAGEGIGDPPGQGAGVFPQKQLPAIGPGLPVEDHLLYSVVRD